MSNAKHDKPLTEADVLRRMLNTRPTPHVAPKAKQKPAKRPKKADK